MKGKGQLAWLRNWQEPSTILEPREQKQSGSNKRRWVAHIPKGWIMQNAVSTSSMERLVLFTKSISLSSTTLSHISQLPLQLEATTESGLWSMDISDLHHFQVWPVTIPPHHNIFYFFSSLTCWLAGRSLSRELLGPRGW